MTDTQQPAVDDSSVAERQSKRWMAWFKAWALFLKGTANALTKAAICLGTLGVFVSYPGRLQGWSVAAIVICVYGFDLARDIRVSSKFITIDFHSADSKSDDSAKSQPETE